VAPHSIYAPTVVACQGGRSAHRLVVDHQLCTRICFWTIVIA
jgi:hypothetical protein